MCAQKIKAAFVEPMLLLSGLTLPQGERRSAMKPLIDVEVVRSMSPGDSHSTLCRSRKGGADGALQTSGTFGEIIEHFGTWTSKEKSLKGART
jgi:hypothetical protein